LIAHRLQFFICPHHIIRAFGMIVLQGIFTPLYR